MRSRSKTQIDRGVLEVSLDSFRTPSESHFELSEPLSEFPYIFSLSTRPFFNHHLPPTMTEVLDSSSSFGTRRKELLTLVKHLRAIGYVSTPSRVADFTFS